MMEIDVILSWRRALCRSDLTTTTKHVLQTLSMSMNLAGRCWPTLEKLAESCGMSRGAVQRHLRMARDAGWLQVDILGVRVQSGRRNVYCACWPAGSEPYRQVPYAEDLT